MSGETGKRAEDLTSEIFLEAVQGVDNYSRKGDTKLAVLVCSYYSN
jgi:hypothetical protein